MKIYRVTTRRSGGEHDGFEYFSNKAVAEKRQREANSDTGFDEDEEDEIIGGHLADEVEAIEFTPTKIGILKMLNAHCSYPDNG